MGIRAVLVFALLAGAPSTAAACSCIQTLARDEAPRPLFARPRIFLGHVLLVDKTPSHKVLFVTESSWRGPMPDTVTLTVRESPCAYYAEGGRYLVLADVDSAGALVTARCDDSWNMRAAARMMAELGSPDWIAPPAGLRSLDRMAIRLGSPGPPTPAADSLVFPVPRYDDMRRFEIADWAGDVTPRGKLLYLKPGLYRFRVTWTDGTRYDSYLWLRCGAEEVVRSPCQSFRFLGNLR